MTKSNGSVVRFKPKQTCTENTPVQVWRPGTLRRTQVSGTSLPGAWGATYLAKVSEHTYAIFGSKWPCEEHRWSINFLLVVWRIHWFKTEVLTASLDLMSGWDYLFQPQMAARWRPTWSFPTQVSDDSVISRYKAQITNMPFLTPQAKCGQL